MKRYEDRGEDGDCPSLYADLLAIVKEAGFRMVVSELINVAYADKGTIRAGDILHFALSEMDSEDSP